MPPSTPKTPNVARIKVRALRTGYYDEERKRTGAVFVYRLSEKEAAATRERRRRNGDPENDGLPLWLERVAANTPESNTTGQQEINQKAQETRDQMAAAKSSTDQEVL